MTVTENSTATARQRRGILLTVLSLIAIMALFLSLVFHKIITPRHLSPVELNINGLILSDDFPAIEPFELHRANASEAQGIDAKEHWYLLFVGGNYCVVSCKENHQNIKGFINVLNGNIREQMRIVIATDKSQITAQQFDQYQQQFGETFEGIIDLVQNRSLLTKVLDLPLVGQLNSPDRIAIINPNGQYHGYFEAPFERDRMVLTFSSIITHF